MKKILVVIAVAAIMALVAAGVSVAGISSTKHNLSSTGTGTIKADASQQNNEICIWCHTPHQANQTDGPLWNKAAAGITQQDYIMYGTTTAGNTPDATPADNTKACLSCHDGVNAVNALVNQAGTGGYNSAGALVAFGATPAGTAVTIPNTSAAYVGIDLSNDHPVSITYVAGDAGLKVTTATLSGTWIGATTVGELLRSNKVECGSCHEPHTSVNSLFLRTTNAQSALCLGCHDK